MKAMVRLVSAEESETDCDERVSPTYVGLPFTRRRSDSSSLYGVPVWTFFFLSIDLNGPAECLGSKETDCIEVPCTISRRITRALKTENICLTAIFDASTEKDMHAGTRKQDPIAPAEILRLSRKTDLENNSTRPLLDAIRMVVSPSGDNQLRNRADAALRLGCQNLCRMAEWRIGKRKTHMGTILETDW